MGFFSFHGSLMSTKKFPLSNAYMHAYRCLYMWVKAHMLWNCVCVCVCVCVYVCVCVCKVCKRAGEHFHFVRECELTRSVCFVGPVRVCVFVFVGLHENWKQQLNTLGFFVRVVVCST